MDSVFIYNDCCYGHFCINESSRILLVSALITLPVAIAMRLTKGFKQLIILSIVIGECSVILGLTLAFYINISPGGVIVVLLVLILGITMLLQKTKRTAKRSIKL